MKPTEIVEEELQERSDYTMFYAVWGLFVIVFALFFIFGRDKTPTAEREFVYSGSVQQQFDTLNASASGVTRSFELSKDKCNSLAKSVSQLKDNGLTVTSNAFDKEFTICESVAYASNKLSWNTNTGSER